jgi:transcriptional regulator with XRE-family HTH domain
MYDNNIFSVRVKELRMGSKLTQSALGEAIGLTKQAVNDIEHNRKKTTLDRACALADYFGVSLDYLVGRSDDPAVR